MCANIIPNVSNNVPTQNHLMIRQRNLTKHTHNTTKYGCNMVFCDKTMNDEASMCSCSTSSEPNSKSSFLWSWWQSSKTNKVFSALLHCAFQKYHIDLWTAIKTVLNKSLKKFKSIQKLKAKPLGVIECAVLCLSFIFCYITCRPQIDQRHNETWLQWGPEGRIRERWKSEGRTAVKLV